MNAPISSRIRVMLAWCLTETGTPATQAVDAATALIETLRSRGFDIVHSDWMDNPVRQKEGPITWDEMATMADQIEKDFGRKPWLP
jgi:hypothetical protein